MIPVTRAEGGFCRGIKIRSQEVEEEMRDALPGGVDVNSGEDGGSVRTLYDRNVVKSAAGPGRIKNKKKDFGRNDVACKVESKADN